MSSETDDFMLESEADLLCLIEGGGTVLGSVLHRGGIGGGAVRGGIKGGL